LQLLASPGTVDKVAGYQVELATRFAGLEAFASFVVKVGQHLSTPVEPLLAVGSVDVGNPFLA
jgi:hypothetical protein